MQSYSETLTPNLRHSCLLISAANAILLDVVWWWLSHTPKSAQNNNYMIAKHRNSNIQTLQTINWREKLFQIVCLRYWQKTYWVFPFFLCRFISAGLLKKSIRHDVKIIKGISSIQRNLFIILTMPLIAIISFLCYQMKMTRDQFWFVFFSNALD